MSRLKDAVLGKVGYAIGKDQPMVDLKNGAQMGYQPDYASLVSNSAYVKRNLITFLVESPRGFQDLDNPDRWVGTLKALVELHAKTIEGLQSTLTVEYSETPVGGAGEMQEDVTNVTRARSNPSFTWTEKYGKPINAFLDGWILNLIMDPQTKFPAVVTRGSKKPTDLLPDYNGMTVMFVEPDPTHTKVVQAWLCTNMRPKTGGDVTGRRDLTAAGETVDYQVEFTAVTQVGAGVNKFAQRLLDEMTLTGANPNLRPAFVDQITADVKAGDAGYTAAVNNAGKTAVKI